MREKRSKKGDRRERFKGRERVNSNPLLGKGEEEGRGPQSKMRFARKIPRLKEIVVEIQENERDEKNTMSKREDQRSKNLNVRPWT